LLELGKCVDQPLDRAGREPERPGAFEGVQEPLTVQPLEGARRGRLRRRAEVYPRARAHPHQSFLLEAMVSGGRSLAIDAFRLGDLTDTRKPLARAPGTDVQPRHDALS